MTFAPLTEPVDFAIVAGHRTPGVCEIQNVDTPFRWDERRGYAQSGSTIVFRGAGLTRPLMLLRLVTDQDWEDWRAFSPIVMREPAPDAAEVRAQGRRLDAARRERDELVQQIGTDPRVVERDPTITDRLERAGRRANQPAPLGAIRRPRALDIWHPILEDWGVRSVVVENVLQPKQTGDGEWTIEVRLIEYRVPVFALARPEGSQAAPQDRFEALIQQADAENQALRDQL